MIFVQRVFSNKKITGVDLILHQDLVFWRWCYCQNFVIPPRVGHSFNPVYQIHSGQWLNPILWVPPVQGIHAWADYGTSQACLILIEDFAWFLIHISFSVHWRCFVLFPAVATKCVTMIDSRRSIACVRSRRVESATNAMPFTRWCKDRVLIVKHLMSQWQGKWLLKQEVTQNDCIVVKLTAR
jgi:hypothetical protein